jgi:hypothetical protein
MPIYASEYFTKLAAKAGIDPNDEELTTFLAVSDLQKIPIPDNLANSIDGSLLSIAEAKNEHPQIKWHYVASALNGVNTEMDKLMDDLKFPDDVKAVVRNEKSTPKRQRILVGKLEELYNKKMQSVNNTEKQTFQAEIEKLQGELRQEKDAVENVRKEYQTKEFNTKRDQEIDFMLSEYKTVFDESLPKAAKRAAMRSLIDKALQDKNADFTLDDSGRLKLIRKDGANVFGDDNRPWDPKILIETTLSQNKVLKVNDSPPPKTADNTPVIPGANGEQNTLNVKDPMLRSLAQKSIADLDRAEKQPVM